MQRVGTARELEPDAGGRLAVIFVVYIEILGAEPDACHVAEANLRAVGIDLHQDAAEFLRRAQERCLRNRRGQALRGGRRRAAELTAGDLNVLRQERSRHIHRCQREAVESVRVEPDAHRVLRPEHVDVADTVEPAHRVLHVRDHIVGDVVLGHVRVGGDERGYEQKGSARLRHLDARLLDLRRQERYGERQLVLHLHLRGIRVGPGQERERGGRSAEVIARRGKIQQVIEATHLLFDDLHDRILDRGRRGAGIGRGYLDGGRCNRRILLDRQRQN